MAVIMGCIITPSYKFRTQTIFGFKHYIVILRKEQSVLTKIIISFEGENVQAQCNVLSYRNDLYFHFQACTKN